MRDAFTKLENISTSDLLDRIDNAPSIPAFVQTIIDPDSDLAALERTSLALASRLELAASSTSSSLDSLLNSTAHSVPRLTYDLTLLRDAALDLKSAIVSSQIALKGFGPSVEQNVIENALDALKSESGPAAVHSKFATDSSN